MKIAIEDRVIEVDDNASQAEIEDIVNDFSVRLAGEKEKMAKIMPNVWRILMKSKIFWNIQYSSY